MKHMSLQEIAAACSGIYHGDASAASREVSGVVIDSRKVEKDNLFVAIKGARVDGHTFIPQVMEQGALCALSEQDLGDVRVTSHQGVRDQVNSFMTNVMNATPLKQSLMVFDDSNEW